MTPALALRSGPFRGPCRARGPAAHGRALRDSTECLRSFVPVPFSDVLPPFGLAALPWVGPPPGLERALPLLPGGRVRDRRAGSGGVLRCPRRRHRAGAPDTRPPAPVVGRRYCPRPARRPPDPACTSVAGDGPEGRPGGRAGAGALA